MSQGNVTNIQGLGYVLAYGCGKCYKAYQKCRFYRGGGGGTIYIYICIIWYVYIYMYIQMWKCGFPCKLRQ